jgi:endo-1,4-beta-D-glucanase Y
MSSRPLCVFAGLAGLLGVAGAHAQNVAYAPLMTAASPSVVSGESWRAYRDRFIQPDGRLVDLDNGGVSHSEGQGYGMLLAVLANDRETFGRLWTWTAQNLFIRGDNLAAWRWHPNQTPNVRDQNNATDGDLLIAWALARAAKRWNSSDYRMASRRIALAVSKLIDKSNPQAPILPPGAFGFGRGQMADGPVINLSYLVFPAFDELKTVAAEVDWDGLKRSSAALVEKARFAPTGLPADWISLATNQLAPAQFQPAVFGYESIRIPLYVAWSSAAGAKTLLPFTAYWKGAEAEPAVIDIKTGKPKEPMREAGYRAIVALAHCAASGQVVQPALTKVEMSRYYSATLQMLSLAAMAEKYPYCLTGSASASRK